MEPTVVGVDIAKRVFQLHWIAADIGEVFGKQLRRSDFLEHFANRGPCLIGLPIPPGRLLSVDPFDHEVSMRAVFDKTAAIASRRIARYLLTCLWFASRSAPLDVTQCGSSSAVLQELT